MTTSEADGQDLAKRLEDTERKLERAEKLFRLLSEATREVVYQCGPDGVIFYCSPSLLELLGYSADELEGRSEEILYHPDDIRKLRGAKDKSTHQFRMRRACGKYLWFEVTTGYVSTDEGLSCIQRIGQEITERKKMRKLSRKPTALPRSAAGNGILSIMKSHSRINFAESA
ncbi:PAS domain-containing protein [Cohnella pontilimi]|nr:PAS domain S-box protein [Cohnella pontilimi]